MTDETETTELHTPDGDEPAHAAETTGAPETTESGAPDTVAAEAPQVTHETVAPDQPTEGTKPAFDESRFEPKWRKKSDTIKTHEAAAPSTAPDTDLQQQLEQERQRVRDLQDRWQRAAADLANFRKRTEQERGDMERFASMLLVSELLPVLDNFERALATIPGNLAMLTWIQGVMLIERHFRAILEHQGLAPVEAEGQQFNPHLHEAINERETDEAAPGTIIQVYQKGYTMHGRVIRPTLVEIATAPATSSETAADEASPADSPEDEASEQEESGEVIAEEAETENAGP